MIKYGQDHSFLPNFCSIRPLLLLIIFAEMLAIAMVLIRTPLNQFQWVSLALFSFYIQWVALLSGALICLLRRIGKNLPPQALGIIGYVVILFCTAVVTFGAHWMLLEAAGKSIYTHLSWEQMLQPVLVSAIIGGLLMRYWYLQGELQRQQRSELIHRIDALQSRIRPHFLFNSMNTLASLISSHPERAEQVVEDLADLFRASLQIEKKEISIEDELLLCERYLRIEMLRLGGRLQVEWQIDKEQLQTAVIPPLTLQPIIENAITHGVQSTADGGVVVIRVERSSGMITLLVENPFDKKGCVGEHSGNRIALNNIVRRLKALYGDKVVLKSGPIEQGYRTYLNYPDIGLSR